MEKLILIAFDLNPILGSECGTAHIWLEQISKHFAVEVFVDSRHKNDIERYNYGSNVNFIYIENGGIFINLFIKKMKLYNIEYAFFIKKLKPVLQGKILNSTYKLIHCITPAGIHSYNNLFNFKIPVIIGPIGGGLPIAKNFERLFTGSEKIKNFLRNAYYKSLTYNNAWSKYFTRAITIIVGTEYVREIIPKECRSKSIVVFDTAIDISKFSPDLIKQHRNETVVSFIGRLEPVKGADLLIEALSLINKNLNFTVNVVGDGTQKNKLIRKTELLGLDSIVHFWGKINREEVINVLKKSDIFCLPTLREPGGVSIIEAMACQLPIVTTDYGGPAYSVDSSCGIKIKPNNPDQYVKELALALEYLIINSEVREKMGQRGRLKVIEEFSAEAIEKKIVSIYQAVGLSDNKEQHEKI